MNVSRLPADTEPVQLIYSRDAAPPPEIVPQTLLTPVQGQVLRELLQGSTMTAAARAYGIHRSTVNRWMQQDNFRLTLENTQRELHLATFFQIQSMIQPGLTRLGALMLDPKTSPAATLRIYQCLAAQQHKALPAAPTTNSENLNILANLLDPTTPDLAIYISPAELDATKCDTSTPIPETSQPEPNATLRRQFRRRRNRKSHHLQKSPP